MVMAHKQMGWCKRVGGRGWRQQLGRAHERVGGQADGREWTGRGAVDGSNGEVLTFFSFLFAN